MLSNNNTLCDGLETLSWLMKDTILNVENSIIHGMKDEESRTDIKVDVFKEDEFLYITVKDK